MCLDVWLYNMYKNSYMYVHNTVYMHTYRNMVNLYLHYSYKWGIINGS